MIVLLRQLINSSVSALNSQCIFAQTPTIDFEPEIEKCPHCAKPLQVLKTETKHVYTLHIGKFVAHHSIRKCVNCNNTIYYRAPELNSLVPKYSNYGYDIMVYVGRAVFQRYRTSAEVVAELATQNVPISASEVNYLAQKFIVYLAIAHKNIVPQITGLFHTAGGYILHLDGTNVGSSPHLLSAKDELSKIVLANIKIPTENADQIIPFLKDIKTKYGEPLAVVSDMGRGILTAKATVFPTVALFICHFHFLRDIGKDLLEKHYAVIRNTLKHYGISAQLRRRMRQYAKIGQQSLETNIDTIMQSNKNQQYEENQIYSLCYTLIAWALDGKNHGHGFGFPFDRPHLEFYNRINEIYRILNSYKQNSAYSITKEGVKIVETLLTDLEPVVTDELCKNTVKTIVQAITVFDTLRTAMKIAQPTDKDGLNSNGTETDIKTIENQIIIFKNNLLATQEYKTNTDYQKMLAQIDKYWEKLFADPIEVKTPNGSKLVQPQRTNNIMEQFFRDFKKGHRRTTGNNSIAKKLQTMFAETPLVKNLENKDYMKILLGAKATLEEVFAQIDYQEYISEIKLKKDEEEKIPKKIKKLIKDENFQQKFLLLAS